MIPYLREKPLIQYLRENPRIVVWYYKKKFWRGMYGEGIGYQRTGAQSEAVSD